MDMETLSDPRFWVFISFVLFLAIFYKKIARLVTNGLDSRSARIDAEIKEATRLREEAEQVLASYQQRQRESLKEAQAILARAHQDAAQMRKQAEIDLKAALDSRMQMAIEKIAQEETKAIQDVQSHVVDISIAAARSIIMEQLGKVSSDDLLKLAVSDIERKIH
jgi:F-type H+-transporting ATPase subunit b